MFAVDSRRPHAGRQEKACEETETESRGLGGWKVQRFLDSDTVPKITVVERQLLCVLKQVGCVTCHSRCGREWTEELRGGRGYFRQTVSVETKPNMARGISFYWFPSSLPVLCFQWKQAKKETCLTLSRTLLSKYTFKATKLKSLENFQTS